MSSVVNNSCTLKQKCIEVCPVDAFHMGIKMVVIDAATCIDCGLCIEACPESAITIDVEATPYWLSFNNQMAEEWKHVTRSPIKT